MFPEAATVARVTTDKNLEGEVNAEKNQDSDCKWQGKFFQVVIEDE